MDQFNETQMTQMAQVSEEMIVEMQQRLDAIGKLHAELEGLINDPTQFIEDHFNQIEQNLLQDQERLENQVHKHFDQMILHIREKDRESKIGG